MAAAAAAAAARDAEQAAAAEAAAAARELGKEGKLPEQATLCVWGGRCWGQVHKYL